MTSTPLRLVATAAVAALVVGCSQKHERELTVVGWGGVSQAAHRNAYWTSFCKENGVKIKEDVWNGGIGVLRAKSRANRADWDVVQVEVEEEESPGRLLGMELVFLLAAAGFVLIGGGSLELGTTEAKLGLSALEPIGPFEHDPNLTDSRFRGNRTRSYRTPEPLRVVDEVTAWEPHPPEVVQEMLDNLARLKAQGVTAINE